MNTPKQSRYTLKGNRLESPTKQDNDYSSEDEIYEMEPPIIIEPPIRAENDLEIKENQSTPKKKETYNDLELPLSKLQQIYVNLYHDYRREKERYIQLEYKRQKMTKSIKKIRYRIAQFQDETEATNELLQPTFRH